MDLQQELNSVKNELKIYKEHLEQVNAEKIAIDQLLVENLKGHLQSKKEALLNSDKLKKANDELDLIKSEYKKLEDLFRSREATLDIAV